MPVNLKNQVVLIVGASSGIGRATAVLFSKEGARVMAAARREDRLRALKEEHPSIETAIADAGDPAAMERLAAETTERLGPIDILVYNTGTNIKDRALTRLSTSLWDMMLTTNLSGAYYITHAVLPGMRERRSGTIVNVTSMVGKVAAIAQSPYVASKFAFEGVSEGLAQELAPFDIRVGIVEPGVTKTAIFAKTGVNRQAELVLLLSRMS